MASVVLKLIHEGRNMKIQLDTNAMNALFPEGSQARCTNRTLIYRDTQKAPVVCGCFLFLEPMYHIVIGITKRIIHVTY